MERVFKGEAALHVRNAYAMDSASYEGAPTSSSDDDAPAAVKKETSRLFGVDAKAIYEEGEWQITIRLASGETGPEAWRAAADVLASLRLRSRTGSL